MGIIIVIPLGFIARINQLILRKVLALSNHFIKINYYREGRTEWIHRGLVNRMEWT